MNHKQAKKEIEQLRARKALLIKVVKSIKYDFDLGISDYNTYSSKLKNVLGTQSLKYHLQQYDSKILDAQKILDSRKIRVISMIMLSMLIFTLIFLSLVSPGTKIHGYAASQPDLDDQFVPPDQTLAQDPPENSFVYKILDFFQPIIPKRSISNKIEVQDSKKERLNPKIVVVSEDRREVKIAFNNKIKNIYLKGVNEDEVQKVGVDEEVPISAFNLSYFSTEKIYAIDPTQIEFEEASFSAVSQAEELWKCKDWNFSTQSCYGNWFFLQKIEPGEEYNVELTPEDPAFAEVTAQSCIASSKASRGAFVDACDGTYPASCGSATTEDRISCDDTYIETHTYQNGADAAAGLRISSYNTSVNNCKNITKVEVCYEWWVSDLGGGLTCPMSVDADGGASYSDVPITCPGLNPNPGMLCVDVSSYEYWRCNNFFGPTGTRAFVQQQVYKLTGSLATSTWDLLIFNVTFEVYGPNVSSLDHPTNNMNLSENIIDFNFTVFDDYASLENCTLYTNVSGSWEENASLYNPVNGSVNNITVSFGEGSYFWNVLCYNEYGAYNWHPANYTFTVDTTGPLTTLTQPPDFINLSGAAYTLQAASSDARGVDTVSFDYRMGSLGSWVAACSDSVSPYSCSWDISILDDNNTYQIRASANDTLNNQGNYDYAYNITVDNTPPDVFNPDTDDSDLIVRSTDILNMTVDITDLTSITNVTLNSTEMTLSGNQVTYWLSSDLTAFSCNDDGSCILNFNASDSLYNYNDTTILNITVDNTPPGVLNSDTNDTDNLVKSTDSLNITVNSTDLNSVTEVLINGTLMTLSGSSQIWWYVSTPSALGCSEGSCTFSFNATDIAFNINYSETLTITVDDTNPGVFNSETNDSDSIVRSVDVLNLTVNASDVNGVSEVRVNGTSMILSGDDQVWWFSSGLADFGCVVDGSCILNFNASDVAGNYNDTTLINLTIDNTGPSVNITGIVPVLAEYSQDNVSVNWTTYDLHPYASQVNVTYPSGSFLDTYYTNFTLIPADLTELGNYTITLISIDIADNINSTTQQFRVRDSIGAAVSLVLPQDLSYDSDGVVTFNCSASDYYGLENATFYWNYSSVWEANSTVLLEGTLDWANFTRTNLNDSVISWNCLVYDNQSNYEFASENYTVYVDVNPPKVYLENPPDNNLSYSMWVLYQYNTTDFMSNVSSCSLIIDNQIVLTNSSVLESTHLTFNYTMPYYEGQYNWSINCTDQHGFTGFSQTRNITVDVPDTSPPSITLTSPDDGSPDYDGNVTFGFMPVDDRGFTNCSLYHNVSGTFKINQTIYSIINNTEHSFNITGLDPAMNITISWNVQCFDNASIPNEAWSSSNYTVFVEGVGTYYTNKTLPTAIEVNNSVPAITQVDITDPIDLIAGSKRGVWCNATVEDKNGADDVKFMNATLFSQYSQLLYPDNNTNHYTNNSCTEIPSLQTISTKTFACYFDVWYNADYGDWYCNVSALDNYGGGSSEQDSTTVNQLFALSVTPSVIDYGNLDAFETSSTDENITIINLGNTIMDLEMFGFGNSLDDQLAMSCNMGQINYIYQRFDVNPGEDPYNNMINLSGVSSTPNKIDLNLDKQKSSENSSSIINWKLQIPDYAFGSCNGTIVITAVPDT